MVSRLLFGGIGNDNCNNSYMTFTQIEQTVCNYFGNDLDIETLHGFNKCRNKHELSMIRMIARRLQFVCDDVQYRRKRKGWGIVANYNSIPLIAKHWNCNRQTIYNSLYKTTWLFYYEPRNDWTVHYNELRKLINY